MDIIIFVLKNNNYSMIMSTISVLDDINCDAILHVALTYITKNLFVSSFLDIFLYTCTPLSNVSRPITCPHWQDFL